MHVSATIWRTLAILIVLVLASAYLTSYLAARFTSSGGDDDSAHVARWDYELTLVDSGKYLLGTEYADLDSNASTPAKVKTNDFTGTLSVKGQSSVVTPNSSGYATFNMTGGAASEVAAKVWVYSASQTPSLKVGDNLTPILQPSVISSAIVASDSSMLSFILVFIQDMPLAMGLGFFPSS